MENSITGVICVGSKPERLSRLLDLVKMTKTKTPYDRIVVYNGPGEFPGAIKVQNNGWDVRMYYEGTVVSKHDWNFYLNDDVQFIRNGWLDYAADKIGEGCEIVGAQANLSSWGPEKDLPLHNQLQIKDMGRKIRFIRTHAFACTKRHFLRLWKDANRLGNRGGAGKHLAHIFEKLSLVDAKKYEVFPDPSWIYDSNTEPYVRST